MPDTTWTACPTPTGPVSNASYLRDGEAACRRMETRACPESYNGPCGDRPCARFESDTITTEDHQ
jgi:hypothetical protein